MTYDRTYYREIVRRSRAAQGLPPTIQDPAAVERIAAIFRAAELAGHGPTPRDETRGGSQTAPRKRQPQHRKEGDRS